jgi:hypothetical protein
MKSRSWSSPSANRLLLPCALLATVAWSTGCHNLHLDSWNPEKSGKATKDSSSAQNQNPPGKYQFRVSQYVFRSDFEVKRDLPIFRELADLRDQVYQELQLPGANTFVEVFLFENQEAYERFMRARYPDLPKRRAFFVAQPRPGLSEELLVYTYWGDRIHEDLRHELTHALLHSVLKDVPLWLDEGLAEYFEVPPDSKGINVRHLEHIRRGPDGPFKPDLNRLEQLTQVQQMTPAEYREAWAWVHFMLHEKPEAKTVLTNFLQQLRKTANPGLLGPRLVAVCPGLNEALVQHLARLDLEAGTQRVQANTPAPAAQPVK